MLDGQQVHRQDTDQLNTLALLLSHTLAMKTMHHLYTLPPSRIKDTTIKVTDKIKVILEVNSKVLSCSSPKVPIRRNAVESLSMITRLLWVPRLVKRAAMELSDSHMRACKDSFGHDAGMDLGRLI